MGMAGFGAFGHTTIQVARTAPPVYRTLTRAAPHKNCAGERRKTYLAQALDQTNHQVLQQGERLLCTTGQTSSSGRHRIPWLTEPCPGAIFQQQPCANSLGMQSEAPTDGQAPITIGYQVGHSSHAVGRHRGVTWCWKCGAWAYAKLEGLSRPCRPGLRSGWDVIRRGLFPRPSMADWPMPDDGSVLQVPPEFSEAQPSRNSRKWVGRGRCPFSLRAAAG